MTDETAVSADEETTFVLEWEALENEGASESFTTERARVFGGWLVRVGSGANAPLAFVPDAEGRWDGEDFGDEDYEYDEDDEDEEEEGDEDEDEDGEAEEAH